MSFHHLEQEKYESRRLWREVTHGLKSDNIEAATAGKQGLEQVRAGCLQDLLKLIDDYLQKQREEAKQRKETGAVWENRMFLSIGEHWHFKEPLGNRKS